MTETSVLGDISEILKILDNTHLSLNTHRVKNLLHAFRLDENDPIDEQSKIYHLIEAHSPVFRKSAGDLFRQAFIDATHNVFPMDEENLRFNCCTKPKIEEAMDDIYIKIELMPPEWTLVQLTHMDYQKDDSPAALQMTVFECGQNTIKPFTVCVEPGVDSWNQPVNIMQSIVATIKENNTGYINVRNRLNGQITETYTQWKTRLGYELKQHVKFVGDKWLAEWRCLFCGKFGDNKIEQEIKDGVNCLLTEYNKTDISTKKRQILKHLLRAQGFIDDKQTRNILRYCFPEITNQEVVKVLKSMKKFKEYVKLERHPVILIVDGTVDQVPWEMLDVLSGQSVSRMPSFYFAYGLFDAHKTDLQHGWKIMRLNEIKGGWLLNPSANLPAMEKRLGQFQEYWMPEWGKMVGKEPKGEEFVDFLMNFNIFIYSGHGDGMQYVSYHQLEKLRINAVVFLFGCRSVALQQHSPDTEPWGTNQYYIMCCCPLVVGNLYNVTDLDCDMMCTTFLSYWIPGPEKQAHWMNLDLKQWAPGKCDLDPSKLPKLAATSKNQHIPDLLIALNKAKKASKCGYLTQAAIVARGLPVRFV